MNKIVIDLDGTITIDDKDVPYSEKKPNSAVISKLQEYKAAGWEIAIYTARNMKTFRASIGRINAVTLPMIISWLERYNVPYDEIHVGKPWCDGGFYVDDRAVRPSEFTRFSAEELQELVRAE